MGPLLSESETASAWQEAPLPDFQRSLEASVKPAACVVESSSGRMALWRAVLVFEAHPLAGGMLPG